MVLCNFKNIFIMNNKKTTRTSAVEINFTHTVVHNGMEITSYMHNYTSCSKKFGGLTWKYTEYSYHTLNN